MLFVLAFLSLAVPIFRASAASNNCRVRPGDPTFPTTTQFAQLNSSIGGRLVKVVPSGQFCQNRPGGCTDAQWIDTNFLGDIPGTMITINWEQDYNAKPPSLCFRNTTHCGQGSVPLFGVNASTAADIQAGVRFAQNHNLRIAIKSSGHDFLGRSTAKDSLLLWTHYLREITFHDSFKVGGKDQGSAVTVGSGVGFGTLYQASKEKGKIVVGGTSATVHGPGGYVQGAGHSALGPLFGLAADNTLEFQIVIANGSLITANEVTNHDLFWAIRGGGAGSWGVIITATFRTHPTFDAVHHLAIINVNNTADVAKVTTLHAQHIFDLEKLRIGQYFWWFNTAPSVYSFMINSIAPNTTINATNAAFTPFLNAVTRAGFVANVTSTSSSVNDLLSSFPDGDPRVLLMGSRLIPTDVYTHNPAGLGQAYKKIFDTKPPAFAILGNHVSGGQVAANAHIDSAVNPKWRTAMAHIIVEQTWPDSTPPNQVEAIRQDMTHKKIPILDALTGPGAGSYSNEADVREPNFQTTFFGPNYARLSAIKNAYDPHALFIVGAGVGSEKWDAEGFCRV